MMELKIPELAEPTQLPNIICNQPLYQGQTDVGTDIRWSDEYFTTRGEYGEYSFEFLGITYSESSVDNRFRNREFKTETEAEDEVIRFEKDKWKKEFNKRKARNQRNYRMRKKARRLAEKLTRTGTGT